MPLLRILLLALVLWVLFKLVRRIIGPEKNKRPHEMEYEDMVTCTECGVHLPRDQAIVRNGQTFCCTEHADEHD